jgi:hypothetical protein
MDKYLHEGPQQDIGSRAFAIAGPFSVGIIASPAPKPRSKEEGGVARGMRSNKTELGKNGLDGRDDTGRRGGIVACVC